MHKIAITFISRFVLKRKEWLTFMKWKWVALSILSVLLLIALMQIDRQSLLSSIRQIPLWLILLLAALQIASQLLVNLQWYRISKLTDMRISFWDMLYINCQGAVIDSITPGVKFGGEVTRAALLSRFGNIPGEYSAAIVAMQKLFSLSALFLILLLTTMYIIGQVPFLQLHTQVLVYAILSLFLLIFLAMFLIPGRIRELLQKRNEPRQTWICRVRNFLLVLLNLIENVRKNKRALTALIFLSLFIWLLYPVKMYILAMQFQPYVGFVHIGAIAFAAYMVAMLPIFPGGIGGFEGTMSGLLIATGYSLSDAATMTVFFRFITFWFVMLLSLMFIVYRKVVKPNTN